MGGGLVVWVGGWCGWWGWWVGCMGGWLVWVVGWLSGVGVFSGWCLPVGLVPGGHVRGS